MNIMHKIVAPSLVSVTLFVFIISLGVPNNGLFIFLAIVCAILVIFSSKIGIWMFESKSGYKKFWSELLHVDQKSFMILLDFGPKGTIWSIRVLGIAIFTYAIIRCIF